ncbi:MFS transporter [Agathobaculum sp. Marseille-P7918]|uniref:MFS transporter n=1 Tax=Agathobaculum sp. Marseille-P7918 TaxID=2479843 RepID=UPI000F631EB8|nr:MFS transporter [Agathobaculum sp. Marseille-P7918]
MKAFFASLGKQKTYVVAELFLVYFALGIGLIMLGSVLPQLREAYALDYKTGGTLLSVQSVGYLAVGLITGTASVKLGLKRAYLLLYALMPVGFLMMLLYGAPLWLIAAMLLTGLAKGAVTDYNNRIMSDYSGGNATPLNLLHAFFAIGACVAPILTLVCLQRGSNGWRLAMIAALVLLIAALVFGLFMHIEDERPAEGYQTPASGGFGFFREHIFWQTTAIGFFYQAVEASMMGWLTTFYIDSGALDASAAQIVTSLLWVALLVGRFSCSLIAAHWKPWQMMLVMCTGIAAFLALLVCATALPLLLIATAGLGLCMSGMYGTSVSNAGDIFSRYPICMGLFVSITGVGGAVAPTVVGLAADHVGIRFGFAMLLIAAICLLAAAILNAHTFRSK